VEELENANGAVQAENTKLQTRVEELENANADLRAELHQVSIRLAAYETDHATLVKAQLATCFQQGSASV
jgi:hypothetical protein